MIEPSETSREVTQRVYALRKSDRAAAMKLAEAGYKRWPDDVDIVRAFGWCRYDLEVKPACERSNNHATATARRAVDWLLRHLPPQPDVEFNPAPIALLQLAKVLVAEKKYNEGVSLLEQVEASSLSRTSDAKFPSQRAQWYGHLTKCLAGIGDWQRLQAVCEQAIAEGSLGSNQQWIEYRLSMAYEHVGDPEAALKRLDAAMAGKRDAWISFARGRLLGQLSRQDEAVDALRTGLARTRDAELHFAWRSLAQIAEIRQPSDPARAVDHLMLAVQVRRREGWPDGPTLRQLGVTLGARLEPASAEVLARQRCWWAEVEVVQARAGRVVRHLAHGGSGFIRGDDGVDYYFSKRRDDDRPLLPIETLVTFEVAEGNKGPRAVRVRKQRT